MLASHACGPGSIPGLCILRPRSDEPGGPERPAGAGLCRRPPVQVRADFGEAADIIVCPRAPETY